MYCYALLLFLCIVRYFLFFPCLCVHYLFPYFLILFISLFPYSFPYSFPPFHSPLFFEILRPRRKKRTPQQKKFFHYPLLFICLCKIVFVLLSSGQNQMSIHITHKKYRGLGQIKRILGRVGQHKCILIILIQGYHKMVSNQYVLLSIVYPHAVSI